MEIKKNDKFTVTIEDMGEDGAGIGCVDGYIWFVKDALIGDTIEASAMKMKKNYGFARLVRVIRQKAAWRRNVRWREPAADASFRNWTIKSS
mgnify:CR=1 FL=1